MNTAFAKDARTSSLKMAAAHLRQTFCAQKAGVGASLAHFLQPFARLLRPLRAKSSKDKVAENKGYIKKTLSLSIFNQPFALPPHARIFGPMRERGAQKAQKVSNRCAQPTAGQEIPMQPLCFDCRFFSTVDCHRADDLAKAHFDDCIQGHCRISPPRVGRFRGEGEVLEYDYGQWPLVLSGEWCGAFQPCQRALRDGTDRSRHVGAGSTIAP